MPATSMPKGNVFSGARARFLVEGTVIGYAQNCTGSEEVQYDPVVVLDHIQTVEFVPVGYTCSFSASRVRLIGDAAGTAGSLRGALNAFPKLGTDDAAHLLNILNLADMQCTIEDTVSGKIFMMLEQVRVASHNWSITPRGIVGEDISFLAVRMKDEAET